jgi:hypothetical protein
MSHEAASLPNLVENLVKNWEVEASFKSDISDWRTIDPANYTFSINGGPPQSAEHMLKVGTYNAIISSNDFYSPEKSDFSSSHKTFKRMMPTFAWEVLEVYSGPPVVAFKWRHWGTMKNDYVGLNEWVPFQVAMMHTNGHSAKARKSPRKPTEDSSRSRGLAWLRSTTNFVFRM